MRPWLTILLALGSSACHILTGFDDLTLRDGAAPIWSERFGDELPQLIDDVVLSPTRLRVAGSFEGTLEIGDEPLVADEPTRFLAQFDANGEAEWSLPVDLGITHHGLVDDTTRVTISHQETVNIAGLELAASGATALEVIDIDPDGSSASLLFGGSTDELVNLHVAQVPDDAQVLVLGATFSGGLGVGDMADCAPIASADQNIAIARIVTRKCSWLMGFGDDGQIQTIDAIAADRAGNIVVAGRFRGTLEFGGEQLASKGGLDYFIVKVAEDGTALWWHRYGHNVDLDQRPIQLAVRPSGTITIAGYFAGSVDFGNGAITSSLGHDIFVAKLDPSGNTVWTKHFPVRNDAPVGMDERVLSQLSLDVDSVGNTILAGHFRANVDFGGAVLASDGDLDMFLVKLNVDGLLEWSDAFGNPADQCQFTDCVTALAVDANDDIIVGGGFAGGMNLGGDDLDAVNDGTNLEASDAFIAKFGP